MDAFGTSGGLADVLGGRSATEVLERGARLCRAANQIVAKVIGIRPAARVTCVKPEGTASLLLAELRARHCHADLGFKFKAGGNEVNMVKIIDGQYCGACHNGELAWSAENCNLCHAGKPGTPTQVHESTLQRFGVNLPSQAASSPHAAPAASAAPGAANKR